jgi:hypothetical protein
MQFALSMGFLAVVITLVAISDSLRKAVVQLKRIADHHDKA